MEFQIADAIQMIGELQYERRMLEENVKTLQIQVFQMTTEMETATQKMAELEAALNGSRAKKKTAGRSESEEVST